MICLKVTYWLLSNSTFFLAVLHDAYVPSIVESNAVVFHTSQQLYRVFFYLFHSLYFLQCTFHFWEWGILEHNNGLIHWKLLVILGIIDWRFVLVQKSLVVHHKSGIFFLTISVWYGFSVVFLINFQTLR